MPHRRITINRPGGNSFARNICGKWIVVEAVHPLLKDGTQFFLWSRFVVQDGCTKRKVSSPHPTHPILRRWVEPCNWSGGAVTGCFQREQRPRMLTPLGPHSKVHPDSRAMSRSRPAACRASWLPNSSKNDSRVSFWPRPPGLGAGALAVLPRTLGTSVWVDLPRNCLISTASTSMPGICAFKNSTTRSNGVHQRAHL